MEKIIKGTIIKRFIAFIFDFAFIMLLAFTVYMLFGLIFKIDNEGYQNFMSYLLLIVIISYMLLGELLLKNTLGKYLLGIEIVDKEKLKRPSLSSFIKRVFLKIIFPIEGLVMLLSKSKKRIGDLWAKTIVIKKEINKPKPLARLAIGIVVLIALLYSFRILMGLAVEKTDFYAIGIEYLKNNSEVEIIGLPLGVDQTRNTVNFVLPVSNENRDKYAEIYLEKYGDEWRVNHIRFFKEHIIGFSYGFNYSSSD
jgi:uncharacterized RDD family membrane protein YckC